MDRQPMHPTGTLNKNTVPYLLERRAAATPSRIAYSFPELGQACSWLELWNQVKATAKGLLRAGIGPGDRIAILMPDRIEVIVTIYSAASIGAVAVPLNTYCRKSELAGYLRDAKAKVMVIGPGCHGIDYPSLVEEIIAEYEPDSSSKEWMPARVLTVDCGTAAREGFEDFSTLASIGRQIDDAVLWSACQKVSPTDPMVLLYTSGTTGQPKRALRSPASFVSSLEKADRKGLAGLVAAKFTDAVAARFSTLGLLPLYHLSGIVTLFYNLLDANVRVVMLQYYHPVRALETLERERCRLLHCTPHMLVRMLSIPECERFKLTKLIGVGFTGPVAGTAVLRKIDEHLGVRFLAVGYGSTEAGQVSAGIVITDRAGPMLRWFLGLLMRSGLMNGYVPQEKIRGSCYGVGGTVNKSVQVRILDIATGKPLPPGIPGEIVVRSYRVMQGGAEQVADGRFTEDGWLRTGDIGYVDEDQCVFVVERVKRVISRGGEKISASEVERCLLTHEGVAEAFVYAIPDPSYGEEVCACVASKPGADVTEQDLRAFLSSRLSAFKVPRDFVLVDALPVAPHGKITLSGVQSVTSRAADDPSHDGA